MNISFYGGSRSKLAFSGTILVLGFVLLGLSTVMFSTVTMGSHGFAAKITPGAWLDARLGEWQRGPFGLNFDRSLIIPLLSSSPCAHDLLIVKTFFSNLFNRTITAKDSVQKNHKIDIES